MNNLMAWSHLKTAAGNSGWKWRGSDVKLNNTFIVFHMDYTNVYKSILGPDLIGGWVAAIKKKKRMVMVDERIFFLFPRFFFEIIQSPTNVSNLLSNRSLKTWNEINSELE